MTENIDIDIDIDINIDIDKSQAIVVDTTANIEFQLSKFSNGEYFKNKYIPIDALFASSKAIKQLQVFYENNLDIPILVHGGYGIGKTSCIIGLIPHLNCYLPEYSKDAKLNNLLFFKVLNTEYSSLLFYENIFFLNMDIINNNTEVMYYLKYIYQIAHSSNIAMYNNSNNSNNSNSKFCLDYDETNSDSNNDIQLNITPDKKIIILTHIDKCNYEAQRYIAFMLDKININASYILTTNSLNTIDKKIISSCAPVSFIYLNILEFTKIFTYNFEKLFTNTNTVLFTNSITYYYNIYKSNNYNIGNTISQIKYHLAIEGESFIYNSKNTCSLISRIVSNFIKKYLVLSAVESSLELRKFLYTLLTINIKLTLFVKEVVKQLIATDYINYNTIPNTIPNTLINSNKKLLIIEKSSVLSKELLYSNKEIVIIESFFYDIISIIYDS